MKSSYEPISPRIMATPSAFEYLENFPFNCTEAFAEVKGNRCKIDTERVEEILKEVKMDFTPNEVKDIPNWNKTLADIIYDTEIWFVADDDRGTTKLPVFNRFSRKNDSLLVPEWIDCGPDFNDDRVKGIVEQIKSRRVRLKRLKESLKENKLLLPLILIAIFRVLHNDPENEISLLKGRILHHTCKILRDILASQEYGNKGMSVLEKAMDILIEMIEGYPKLERSSIERIIKELVRLYEKEGGDGEFLRKMDLPPFLLNLGEEIPNGWLLEIIEMIFRRMDTPEIHQQQENNLQSETDALSKEIHDLWYEDEPSSSMDWLARYCPETGTILMRIDYIKETYESLYEGEFSLELFFQKILLHELIHAAFDLVPRDKYGKGQYEKYEGTDPVTGLAYNEETLDNVLILLYYESTIFGHEIYSVISSQPKFYRAATDICKNNGKHAIIRLLNELISYKVRGSTSVRPKIGRGEAVARFIEMWANGIGLGNMSISDAYQQISTCFPANLRGGKNNTEPIVYTILPASSDPNKNFIEITVGNHKFYVAKNIWTEERFALFTKRAEAMRKKNHKLPMLWG